MNRARTFLLPLLCGLLAAPTFIVLHECGHFLAGKSLGWSATLHYAESQFAGPQDALTQRREMWMSCAGPLMNTLLAASGFLWLRRSRIHQLQGMPTSADWLATTTVVMNAGRWLQCLAYSPAHPLPDDEAWISRAVGLPGWLLPYSLGAIFIVVLIATIRLHPPGNRLAPFLYLAAGAVLGSLLWLKALGPMLLP